MVPNIFAFHFFSCRFKSAGPAKESKAEKRKKEKKGGKGGGGANRPVSGKPGKKELQTNKDQFTMSKQNNLPAEKGGKKLDQETNFQSKKNLNKIEGDEANFADRNSSSYQETGASEDNKENLTIGNETENNEKTISSDKCTEEASNPGQVNIEEKSVGAVYNEGMGFIAKLFQRIDSFFKSARFSSYGCTREAGRERWKCIRIPRGAAY